MLLTSALTRGPIDLGEVEEERVVLALGVAQRRLRRHLERPVLRPGLVLRRAHHHAQRAAGAVFGRDLDGVERVAVGESPSISAEAAAPLNGTCLNVGGAPASASGA